MEGLVARIYLFKIKGIKYKLLNKPKSLGSGAVKVKLCTQLVIEFDIIIRHIFLLLRNYLNRPLKIMIKDFLVSEVN